MTSTTAARDTGRLATAAITAAAAAILAVVYTMQYGFGILPCDLCHGQRTPYFLVVVIGGLSLMPAVDARTRRIVVFHLAGLFIVAAGLGLYHAGVEQDWWQGPTACTTGATGPISMDDVMAGLSKRGRPMCDEIAFSFAGISLAGYNFIAAVILAAASVWAALHKAWWNTP